MKTPILVAALLLAVPLTAAAQDMSYDHALRLYNAMNQINAQVWVTNPNETAAARHALMILRDHRLTDFDAAAIDANNTDPQTFNEGEGCFWYYDEESGEWRERCSDWHTYQCNTVKQLEDEQALRSQVWHFSWIYSTAAMFAAPFSWPASIALGAMSATFSYWEHSIAMRIEQMENNRCVNP